MPEQRSSRPVFHVCGETHVDLAWKKGRGEYAEMIEDNAVRLLDILDHDPDYTYAVEQAAHFRTLAQRRPDLIARFREYLQAGRLEMLGGGISLQETNLPCGESLVRNQLLGMDWVRRHLGIEIRTGWHIDTFGLCSQLPQILNQFGLTRVIANRLGGDLTVDRCRWIGLDGSSVALLGRDSGCPYVETDTLVFMHVQTWSALEHLFRNAARCDGAGPYLVMPYTENEVGPFRHVSALVRQAQAEQTGTWRCSLPSTYFDELLAADKAWPKHGPDLNPEFTGTYSNRMIIRQRNRPSEVKLLEAELWTALAGVAADELVESWWDLAYTHFHDTFTGSCPTQVLDDILAHYDRIDQRSEAAFAAACGALAGSADEQHALRVYNSLPWERTDLVRLSDVSGTISGVLQNGRPLAVERDGDDLLCLPTVPATGYADLVLERGGNQPKAAPASTAGQAWLRNQSLAVYCDAGERNCRAVALAPDGQLSFSPCELGLVLQQDQGHFQIESPVGAEIPNSAGPWELIAWEPTPLGSRMTISGEFPRARWMAADARLGWAIELRLWTGLNRLDLRVTLDWHGEASRIRLRIRTMIDAAGGIYEVPFGTLERRPYRDRTTARGEWPAQRFVAVEDDDEAVALVNTGAAGVEIAGGTIWTTLLRAPAVDHIGMNRDDTSSQHGRHEYRFALVPYAGQPQRAAAVRAAQEVNQPLRCQLGSGGTGDRSLLRLSPENVTLSAVKAPLDGADDELVIRCYEAVGRATVARLWVADAVQAWQSDLTERRGAELPVADGVLDLAMRPFGIATVRVRRSR